MPPPPKGRSLLSGTRKQTAFFCWSARPEKVPQAKMAGPIDAANRRLGHETGSNRGRGGGPFSIDHRSRLPVSVEKDEKGPRLQAQRPIPCCSALDASTRAHYKIYGRTDILDGDGGDDSRLLARSHTHLSYLCSFFGSRCSLRGGGEEPASLSVPHACMHHAVRFFRVYFWVLLPSRPSSPHHAVTCRSLFFFPPLRKITHSQSPILDLGNTPSSLAR